MIKHDPNREVTARAVATITIEVPLTDSWGDGTDIAQVYDQAKEGAEGKIRNAFKPEDRITIKSVDIRSVITEAIRR